MKKTLLIVLCAASLSACTKREASVETIATPEPAPPTIVAAPSATPPQTPEPSTPAPAIVEQPTAPLPRLAPDGVFYLTARKSIMTDDGIIAVAQGARVQLKSRSDTEMIVTDGKREFSVLPSEVTNDLDRAQIHASAEAAQRFSGAMAVRQASLATAPEPTAAVAGANEIERKSRELHARIEQLEQAEVSVRQRIAQARADHMAKSARRAANPGRIVTNSATSEYYQIPAMEAQISEIIRAKSKVQAELRTFPVR